MYSLLILLAGFGFAGAPGAQSADGGASDGSWKANTISPVTNPPFFEDPQIHSEVRPIFLWHNIDKGFITGGGDVQIQIIDAAGALALLPANTRIYVSIFRRNGASG